MYIIERQVVQLLTPEKIYSLHYKARRSQDWVARLVGLCSIQSLHPT